MDIKYFIPKIYQAKDMFFLMKKIESETPYMIYQNHNRDKLKEGLRFVVCLINSSFENTDFFLGVRDSSKIIGYVAAIRGRFEKNSNMAEFEIGILKDYQGLGIGKELLELLNKWAEREKLEKLKLNVLTINKRAISIYENFGFQIVSMKKSDLEIDEKEVFQYHMVKSINL